MFSRRKSFPQAYKFDKKFLESLANDLINAGFDNVKIKLPHNLVEKKEDEISIGAFLERERNYPSVILQANKNGSKDTVKILFVNISKKAFFFDDTFPSGHSESPELYVATSDPARTWGLFEYLYNYLKRYSKKSRSTFLFLFFWVAIIFMILEFLFLQDTEKLLLDSIWGIHMVFDLIGIMASLFVMYSFIIRQGGVYIKEKENKVANMIKRALKGEFSDNPLVTLFVMVLGTILGGVLLKIFNI